MIKRSKAYVPVGGIVEYGGVAFKAVEFKPDTAKRRSLPCSKCYLGASERAYACKYVQCSKLERRDKKWVYFIAVDK